MSRIRQIIEALEAERADAQSRLAWIEQQLDEFRRHEPASDGAAIADARGTRQTPAARSSRKSTASPTKRKRARTAASGGASTRRAAKPTGTSTASRRGDMRVQIIEYLNAHPNSTAGDVAKNLGLKPNSTSTRLSQMAKEGVVTKAQRGYAIK